MGWFRYEKSDALELPILALSRAIVFVSTYDNEGIVVCAHKKLDKTERGGWLADSSLDLAIVD